MAEPCATSSDLISASIDGALAPDEVRALTVHLAGCEACREHEARLRRTVRALRGLGPLVALDEGALAARLAALDARLAASSARTLARTAPLPARVADAHVAPAHVADGPPAARASAAPPAPAKAGRLVPILWGESAWQVVRVAAALAFFAVALSLFKAKWEALQHERQTAERGWNPVVPRTSEAPPPTDDDPPPPPPAWVPDDEPPPAPPKLPQVPEIDPDVAPIPPEPPEPPPPPTTTGAPPEQAPGDPTDPTRQRGPRDPDAGPPTPARPGDVLLADLGDVKRLIASILDKTTAPQQRLSQLRALGDPRFRQRPVVEFLATVLLDGRLDGHALPHDCRRAACGALGRLGTDEAAQALLAALVREPRGDQRDADDAALCAALVDLEEEAAVDRVARALMRLDDDRGLLALRALALRPRAAAVDGLLELYARGRSDPLLREAGAVLGETGDPRALAALAQGVAAGKTTGARQGAALGLGALAARRPADAAACLDGLKVGLGRAERDEGLAVACVRGLRRSGARDAIPLLIELTDEAIERRAAVRGLALQALVAVTGETQVDAAAWRAWWRGGPTLPAPGAARPLGQPAMTMQFFRLPAVADGVVFVLDVSGSMGNDGKWERARAELARALEPLPDRARFQVIFFRDAPTKVFDALVRATRANKARALRALRAQRPLPVASTAIGRALDEALAHADADTIYFVSDGADATQDEAALRLRVARSNAVREVPARLHTILVREGAQELLLDDGPEDPDAPFDIRLMRGIARDSGGVFVRNGRAP